jgi:hypothetical protein
MRSSALFLVLLFCLSNLSNRAVAQAAGTGGTRDMSPAPTMVFPIRPRTEPPGNTAVPNIPQQQRIIRLRRPYYYYRYRVPR